MLPPLSPLQLQQEIKAVTTTNTKLIQHQNKTKQPTMHFTTIALAALTTLLPTTLAQTIRVQNNCTFPVYLRSQPSNNVGAVPLITISPNTTYAEPYKSSGAALKTGVNPMLSAPLTLEYTPSGGLVYYDLSNNAGNPFYRFRDILQPGNRACYAFNCGPQGSPMGGTCYSNGQNIMVKTCQPTDLNLRLCAATV